MQTFSYSDEGLALTKRFEGCRLDPYQDVGGVWTVGYGHTAPMVSAGMRISQAAADSLLLADLAVAVKCVNAAVTSTITQNQFDALVDFCFNVGRRSFQRSELLEKVNEGEFEIAAAQFLLWVHDGSKTVEGLVRRRQAEQKLFLQK